MARRWRRCWVCGIWPCREGKDRRGRRKKGEQPTCAGCADMIERCFVYWMQPGTDVLEVFARA